MDQKGGAFLVLFQHFMSAIMVAIVHENEMIEKNWINLQNVNNG